MTIAKHTPTRHTPGPWVARGTTVFNSGCFFISDCDGLGDPERKSMSEANARLIAAAPDLLTALQDMLDGEGDMTAERVKKARAAITKATGETK